MDVSEGDLVALAYNANIPSGCDLTAGDAAKIIQNAWRGHMNRQIFCFYKNLIGFHTQQLADSVVHSRQRQHEQVGDRSSSEVQQEKKSQLVTANSGQCASTIMKLICPKEAEFMDNAAGTHIRFRLASPTSSERFGSFPPAVYYKIYTHRPVVDLCATAPRDYTRAVNKVKLPKQRFNSVKEGRNRIQNLIFSGNSQTQGWYQRFENNSWRPISDKMLLASLYTAPIPNFKPTVNQRRMKRARDKKKRRIHWMRQHYYSSDKAFTDDSLIEDAIDGIARAVDSTVDGIIAADLAQGDDAGDIVDDDDVQALIEWTCCLDYADYSNYWSHLGTAGFPSIEIMGEKNQRAPQSTRSDVTGAEFSESSFGVSSRMAPIRADMGTGAMAHSETAPAGMDYWTLDQLEAS